MSSGSVKHLFVKQRHKASMSASSKIDLCQEYGVQGDVNANRHSPRQVLIVDEQNLREFSIAPGELRENIVLSGVNSATFKPGARLAFSDGAAIRLTFYCEPCKQVARLVDSLKSIEQKRGILGVVVKDGEIATGDSVVVEPNYFPALSEIPYKRFLNLVDKIPWGRVITYKQILTSMGVDRSYYRVMPLYLKKASNNYPIHRVLDSQGHTISHIPQQKEKLEAEGIKIIERVSSDRYFVSLEDYGWQDYSLY